MPEIRQYKALYFDLHVQDLKKYFSNENPQHAYWKIKKYFEEHSFSHEQYSGYHTKYKTTDMDIFSLIREMRKVLPWLGLCLSHFEVTNVGENHDLMPIFYEIVSEPREKI